MSSLELHRSITENLLLYRRLHGFTQAQLAECLGYSDKSVSKWERGEAIPDIDVLYTLSEIYGVTVSELIGQTAKCRETQDKINAYKKDRRALEKAKKELADEIAFICFMQYEFDKQWRSLRKYANDKLVKIIGDLPC